MKQKILSAVCLLLFVGSFIAVANTRYLPTVVVPNSTPQTSQSYPVAMSNTIAASGYETFPFTNVVTVTNSLATNQVTNITSGVLDCKQQQNLAINVQFQVLNAQTTNHGSVTFTFVPSLDGIVPDSLTQNAGFQFTVTPPAAASATNISFTTNWGDAAMGAEGYMLLQAITNNFTNNVITNILVQYSGKTANTSGY
jgi:hypothetical protein